MKKEILLLILFSAIGITAAAQVKNPSSEYSQNIHADTLPVLNPNNELGILIGGIRFNSFAPEYYLGNFDLNFSTGAIYRHFYGRTALRIGYAYSMQTMHSAGGAWADENAVTGKETGSMAFVGLQQVFFEKGIFQFYVGADLAMANYGFNGYSVSYDETTTSTEQKKMEGIGVNPFYDASMQISPRIKISAESSFGDWFIRERTLVPDPNRYVVTHHFTCAPNPLNAVYISFLF